MFRFKFSIFCKIELNFVSNHCKRDDQNMCLVSVIFLSLFRAFLDEYTYAQCKMLEQTYLHNGNPLRIGNIFHKIKIFSVIYSSPLYCSMILCSGAKHQEKYQLKV